MVVLARALQNKRKHLSIIFFHPPPKDMDDKGNDRAALISRIEQLEQGEESHFQNNWQALLFLVVEHVLEPLPQFVLN